jgi:superkiller protein 3
VNRKIEEVLNDKQKTKELEESRKRTLAAEAEVERLKKELANSKSRNNQDLRAAYEHQTGILAANEYITRGNIALDMGWTKEALEEYHKAYKQMPNSEATYLFMGDVYFKVKNEDGCKYAIEYYKKYLALNPDDCERLMLVGNTCMECKWQEESLSYYEKVESCYKQIIMSNPNNANAYYNLGLTYNDLKNYTEAIKCFQKAIAIDPNDAKAYYNMGIAYRHLKNSEEAIKCFQKAIEINPNHAWSYYAMGLTYYDLWNPTEAIKCYQKAIKINPNHAWSYYAMGNAYLNLTNYTEAIKCYQKAIEIAPNYASAYYNMGFAYYDDMNNKIKCYQQAARLGHENARGWLQKNGYSW